ncbi:adenylosuccinate synthase [Collinsella sp. zg1085]|uniref:adenylosuccinate synthase n=1 Tax=Collinsella sp. zg1085 TaxID=2844380 RepID=UPI001C0C9375|nr:adenylosuccinate synthase [Collinsella sp. zg1085]QWT17618.1 adenylosuccinate synthase [Collinsella sp. zg1085]
MASTVLVGTQWGDEGKGKICDLIASEFDAVVRYQGGNNAGHTIVVDDKKYGLHQVPSGIMYPDCLSVIGNGCVVNPAVLLEEIDMFERDGISTANLKVSGNAHVIMPYHMALDGAFEARLGTAHIGTTKRGIGPCYQHKMERIGLRMQDLLDEAVFREKLERALAKVNPELEFIYQLPTYTVDEICASYLPMAERLRPYICEAGILLNELVAAGKSILFEGAQATLLDIDHGTYPFVTSSNCTAGGAVTGSGVGMKHIDRVLGIMKAYITRVGSGPMPTELAYESEAGHTLTEVGAEYGVTTGRRRRCGWFDGVIARYAAQVNGLTDIALTKLDVLSVFDTIKVCTAYDCNGVRYTSLPEHQASFAAAVPVYTELPGWNCDISQCKTFEELPQAAQDYVHFIEELTNTQISFVAVGPEREQTIVRSWAYQ